MGGNTYNRRHFTDEEINELVRQVDGTKGLFDDRIFETEKQWRANISRHLDADSCQRFYFLLEKIHHCKGCGVMLGIDSYHYISGFRKYCPVCLQNGEFRKNLTEEQRRNRGKKISQAKKKFYQTEYGKSLAKSNGKKISTALKKFHQSPAGEIARQKSSEINREIMNKRILEGSFTPNTNNRNTHWESEWNQRKYRSSWEAAFHQLNPECEYEALRIKYNYQGKDRIYIVDFVDHKNKIVAEVKPAELFEDLKTKAKIASLSEWARQNQYCLILADQEYFRQKTELINLEEFDINTQRKLRNLLS